MAKQAVESPKHQPNEDMLFPSLQAEMNRLFDQFRTGFPVANTFPAALFGVGGYPAVDIVDREDVLEISAELPGVKQDELDVSISGDVLTLKGEKTYDHEDKDQNFHRIERRYGSFRRQVPLGFTPENGAVSADFADGILKLSIRKPATAAPQVQKIDIGKS